MTKKKLKPDSSSASASLPIDSAAATKPAPTPTAPPPSFPLPPTLVICRNKHWRYISSYHGPWLNLPPEVLESLAYSNFYSPRPQPVDPAVFFDLVKIRRLIDDATSLAVRAANGTTSAALNTSLNATNGMLNGADAEILGLGSSRGGGNAKLSRERKHRMREHATQKLSHAYHLDEIAASVATMQSASALEDVAKLVLQRNESDPDAKYVHFFHEKIPSRALAECTSLEPLNDIIRQKPTEASPYRTRAVTRIFKEDYAGAARDLSDGLAVCRLYHSQHQNEQRDLVLAKDAAKLTREYRPDGKVDDKDQPSSLEPQLLFHRGGAYLTLACDKITTALLNVSRSRPSVEEGIVNDAADDLPMSAAEKEETRARLEARRLVRTYAKRALRDYLAFLSHFDYTPGLSAEYTEAFLHKVSNATNGRAASSSSRSRSERLLDIDAHSHSGLSEALVRYEGQRDRKMDSGEPVSQIPKPKVYKLNTLFAALPPADLPPYPPPHPASKSTSQDQHLFNLPDFSEAVTYHPLLTDVLHSLLLVHSLLQTSVKEHARHAYMAARIARVCDGYPIFLAARSPARADWIEVLRRGKNWLSLERSWETLCAPAPLPGHAVNGKEKEAKKSVPTKTQNQSKKLDDGMAADDEKRERIKRVAIEGALSDERVVDEASFRASVRAREMVAAREEEEEQRREYLRTTSTANPEGHEAGQSSQQQPQPRRWAQEDGKEYPITTERAEAIVRWIREAPPPSGGGGSSGGSKAKKKSAGGGKGRVRKVASQASSLHGLEHSVESLDMVD